MDGRGYAPPPPHAQPQPPQHPPVALPPAPATEALVVEAMQAFIKAGSGLPALTDNLATLGFDGETITAALAAQVDDAFGFDGYRALG